MILRGFILEPNETPREALHRIALADKYAAVCNDQVRFAELVIAEYDARLALGHPPDIAALETAQEYKLDMSYDTEELLKGETSDGRSDKPL